MTADQFAKAWNNRVENHGPRLRAEFRAIGELAHQLADRLLTEEVYSKPEDRARSGRPKWRRTNYLAAHEMAPKFADGPDGFDCRIENTAAYAEPRHEANKPGRRQIDLARTAHWHDDMVTVLARTIPDRLARLQIRLFSEEQS